MQTCFSPHEVKMRPTPASLFPAMIALTMSALSLPAVANPPFDGGPLIPRSKLFANGDRMRVRLSPDGKWLGFVAPTRNADGKVIGLGIYRAPVDRRDDVRPVLEDNNPRIPEYHFSLRPEVMFFLRDVGGNENNQLHVIDLAARTVTNITNDDKVKTQFVGERPKHPGRVYYAKNDRDERYFDIYVYDVDTRASSLVFKNEIGFIGTVVNDDGVPTIGLKYDESGDMDYFINRNGEWQLLMKVPLADATGTTPVGFDFGNNLMFLVDSRSADTARLTKMDLSNGESTSLAQFPKADIVGAIRSFDGTKLLAAEYNHLRRGTVALSAEIEMELARIKALDDGDFQIMSQSSDDRTWLIAFFDDAKSIRYFLWDRVAQKGQLAFVMQPELDELPLSRMIPAIIRSRDGLELVSYLTLPRGIDYDPRTLRPVRPLPMVLTVHGGPWTRDSWGYNPEHQWLANRGYAVLSVNYRGSTGFGKRFVNASFGEWGGKMHDDLIDAVNWAIAGGITERGRVAIMGASYGGYAALVGAAFTPDVFTASIDIVGVANLITMDQTIPSYWKPFKKNNVVRMGADVDTEKGREFLWSRSPLSKVDQIRIPLLVAHGDNDPRVKLSEAEQIVGAMQAHGLPVTLIRFQDEGHGFARDPNRQAVYGACEAFLRHHLGGRAERVSLPPTTSMNVPVGAELIPGLPEALEALKRTGP